MVYVYFIKAGNKAIKIGSAKNVKKRLNMLQTGNHEELTISASIGFDTESEARGYERKLHRLFQSQRIRGEWFEPGINMKKITDPTARFKLQRKHKDLKKKRDVKEAIA